MPLISQHDGEYGQALNQIKNNDPNLNNVEVRGLSIEECREFLTALQSNTHVKTLKIDGIEYIDELVDLISELIEKNNTLSNIELNAPQQLTQVNVDKIMNKLEKNINITSFKLNSNDNKKFIKYSHRNKLLNAAAKSLALSIISEYLNKIEHNNEMALALARLFSVAATNSFKNIVSIMQEILTLFTNPTPLQLDIMNKIKTTNDYLKRIKDLSVITGVSPLSIYATNGNDKLLGEGIQVDPLSISIQDKFGKTPLHYAIEAKHLPCIKLLCENNASLVIGDNSNKSPLNLARMTGDATIVALLVDNNKKYGIQKELYSVFGGNKLNKLKLPFSMREGGFAYQGVKTLTKYFMDFINKNPDDKHLLQIMRNINLATINAEYPVETQEQMLKQSNKLLLTTGCIGHVLGVCIEKKNENEYLLSFAERGLFSDKAPRTLNNKRGSILSVIVADSKLHDILNKLKQANNEHSDVAKNIFFNEIPALVGNKWQYNMKLSQKAFKTGICFFGNMKTLLLSELSSYYGEENGLRKYKEFTLYLRKALLQDYKNTTSNDDPFIALCEDIIQEKDKKFDKSYRKN